MKKKSPGSLQLKNETATHYDLLNYFIHFMTTNKSDILATSFLSLYLLEIMLHRFTPCQPSVSTLYGLVHNKSNSKIYQQIILFDFDSIK